MLSICVTVKNRRALFARCIAQLNKCRLKDAELIVADWGSTDCDISDWLRQTLDCAQYDLTTIYLPGDELFSRGLGLNRAAGLARSDNLFFIDADMLIPKHVFDKAETIIKDGKAYFPICWSYTNKEHTRGRWRANGKGIVAIPRGIYAKAGKWPEIRQWGSEDRLFFDAVEKIAPIVRENEKELYHQWHPPSSTPKRPR